MSQRTKIFLVIGCLALGCLVLGAVYQKEIRIAYHRNRMWAAAENAVLLDWSLANQRKTKPTLMLLVKSGLFGMTSYKESQAIQRHEEELLKLDYLERRQFWFTNRICVNTDTNLWAELRPKVDKTFDAAHWCSYYFPETNKFQVTAPPGDIPKWEKLVLDFDR